MGDRPLPLCAHALQVYTRSEQVSFRQLRRTVKRADQKESVLLHKRRRANYRRRSVLKSQDRFIFFSAENSDVEIS